VLGDFGWGYHRKDPWEQDQSQAVGGIGGGGDGRRQWHISGVFVAWLQEHNLVL
jgi:hypothetical protein